ncbi:hypothetical protein APE_0130.1 [Aeropyrum pernix K1]|uniref:Uncharacterized protein n=1 Tax=Aeropyrum pernix (strain ATCC 700893 / DSM 11879 / JCM 9820 / NBRC 100138 / K1) TaxID=272557 RepID=Q9YFX0_AERPE|nr:hypothetical protein [Aeropyrum pernix]BAA79041.2 hypothetical protein APE_0130.1 [Aeropyrum pernix K1]
MSRLRIALALVGLAAALWLRDLHLYYLDYRGLPPAVSGITVVDLEAVTRTIVDIASLSLAVSFIVSPAYSLAVGMIWAAADAILWLDPQAAVYTAALSLAIYTVANLASHARNIKQLVFGLLELAPLAVPIAAACLLYIIIERLPFILVSRGVLRGDTALLATVSGATLAWDFAAAAASLFLVGLIAPRIYIDILTFMGGSRVAVALAREEALESLEDEARGSFEHLSSYLASLLASMLLAPLVRDLLKDLSYALVGWIHWILAEAAALLPLVILFYVIKRTIYVMVTGRLDSALQILSVILAASLLASAVSSQTLLLEALTGIPASESSLGRLDYVALPEAGLAIEYSLRRLDEVLSIVVRLFWGG